MVFTLVCWLLVTSQTGPAATPAERPRVANDVEACLQCHAGARGIMSGPMSSRAAERRFADRAFGPHGAEFFEGSCGGCHVSTCRDCHGEQAHGSGAPKDDACLRCHRGYFVGPEYHGRAPREDHERYQRGPQAGGERFLRMLPDVHQQRGLGCASCHSMASLQHGGGAARTCVDCHPAPSRSVPEHAIEGHLRKMECYACHSAWGAQEYGTFLVKARTPDQQEAFSSLPAWGPWRKSAYLKRQDVPPLGLNVRGRVSPIRPQFVLFATDADAGRENQLLAAEWKAYFPHTVRRGTTTCNGCHDSPRRFVLERDEDRLHLLDKDGLAMRSFWNRDGQAVVNGSFFPSARYVRMNRKSPEYVREYLRQWNQFLAPADR
jgi:hypothetical protein